MKEELVCPICKKTEEHDDFYNPYEDRTRAQVERACGFKVSPPIFHSLCYDCREWVLFLATSNNLNDEKRDILKGGENGEEKEDAVQGTGQDDQA